MLQAILTKATLVSNRKEYKLPPIPEKRYFTIGETSDLCGVKPHVLRYWEQEFSQLKPVTRRGNRRYYQHKDVLLIRQIRNLLYEQCYTISGARQVFAGDKHQPLMNDVLYDDQKTFLSGICNELEDIASELSLKDSTG